ncbi:histidine kinase [uncultured Croceitalea sp.]|uniref:sensor histidine kinase n=1 Tax=uncultured Croceitalea sp. TaxID=1798908 RepID=UPI0033068FF4
MVEKNTFIDIISQKRQVAHLLFWLGLLFVFMVLATINSGSLLTSALNHLTLLPLQICAAYLLNYYQIPKLLLNKKYLAFSISLLFSIYILSALGRITVIYLVEPFIREDFTQESVKEIFQDTQYLFSAYFPTVYSYALLMLFIKAFKTRFEEKHRIEVLQKEKATNELKFLRAQIQPHFLFNTLNNLYALTLAKSDVAPEVVLKLSEILDFILNQSEKPTILIHKEIELLKAFIELETLRYGNRLNCSFKHEIIHTHTQIAPLLFLPLVENAFKHGTKGLSKNTSVEINLTSTEKMLSFKINNDKNQNANPSAISSSSSGIGISNLKRQLELNYPDKHNLTITETMTDYTVELTLDLN